MHQYNHHFPDDATPESLVADREKLLKGILGKIGANPFIEPPMNIDYGCNITIGDNFYSNFKSVNHNGAPFPAQSPARPASPSGPLTSAPAS